MRSYLSKEEFFVKMKRKPAQEQLYQKALNGTLTEEEISSSGQNYWIQDVLRDLVKRKGLTKSQLADKLADMLVVSYEIKLFPVYVWNHSDFTIIPEKGFSLDISKGQHMLIDKDQLQVKIDFSIMTLNSAQIEQLISNSLLVGDFSDRDFIELVGQRIAKS